MTAGADARRSRIWARDLGMGARFAFTGPQGWIRTVLTAVGVALGVAMLLLAASVPQMMSAQTARNDARQINGTAGSSLGNVSSTRNAKPTDETLLSENASTTYHGKELYGRTLQADGEHPVTPPGVGEIPKPGEMVVSPALKKLLASDEGAGLRERLDFRTVGVIGEDGLLGPSDMTFYAGADKLKPGDGVERVEHFGGAQSDDSVEPVLILLAAVACSVLLMPVAVFIGTAARFGGERRDRRLAALRLVGADAAMTRRIAAGESLAGALVGLVLGGTLFALSRQLIGNLTLFDLSVFPTDVQPGLLLGALVVIGVPVVAVAVSVFALRGVTIEPLGVMRDAATRPRRLWWRLVVPLLGLALLLPLAGTLSGGGGSVNEYQVSAGVVLLLSGVSLLLPWMVERLVGRMRGGPVSWQLATRRLQLSTGTATRAVSGITIAVAGAIALQLLFAGVEAESTHRTKQERSSMQQVNVSDSDATLAEAKRMTRVLKNTEGVTSATGSLTASQVIKGKGGDEYAEVMVGDCATLRDIAHISSCREGQAFRAEPGKPSKGDESVPPPPRAGTALNVHGPGGKGEDTWRIPSGTPTVKGKLKGWGMPVAGILVTPSALSPDRLDASYNAWANTKKGDSEALDNIRTTVFHQNPSASAQPLLEKETSAGFVQLSKGIFAAATGVLLLIAASMVISQLEQLRERRRQLAVLVAFGTRRSTLSASVLWQSAVPVVLGLALASVSGLGLGWALLKVIDRPVSDWLIFWQMAGVGGALIVLVTLLSMPVLWRLMRVENLRTE
ncbi:MULTISPECIES: ABC transporter permease [unclassified Streptomyces]|uniref:ABC transporter permease n=1 Tax=unclassified Streptomyces TaxID=2593676 RepID=UPI002DDA14A5|nr:MULTISPECIES: ABC transporter permease [unclassified Streptomyces]WSA92643.1 ABC transporter permease [Streptomyces sp. NBC_01795]WSB77009.1 ABC transporter permease [Streptomyces sp. NBC_01775]WSS14720.1 ABC transporter permease [Streptomyces sp. NBC_01186]WSS43548.1 ABC transporter permease [Streptomyces sp. NBC_01187]